MKDKHTPTPWKVRFFGGKDDGENMFFVEAINNNKPELGYGIEILQEDFGEHNGYPREQRLADAKLIAAAPEMLAALQNIANGQFGELKGDFILRVRNLCNETIKKAIQ